MHTSETIVPCSSSGLDGVPSHLFSLSIISLISAASWLTCGNGSAACSASSSFFLSSDPDEFHRRWALDRVHGAALARIRADAMGRCGVVGWRKTGTDVLAAKRLRRGGILGICIWNWVLQVCRVMWMVSDVGSQALMFPVGERFSSPHALSHLHLLHAAKNSASM